MLDPTFLSWARSVLDAEGLGEWRVYVAPGPCLSQCRHATREILVSPRRTFGLLLLEVARLVEAHTVPVSYGFLVRDFCNTPIDSEGVGVN
jgi:hypothetical protein